METSQFALPGLAFCGIVADGKFMPDADFNSQNEGHGFFHQALSQAIINAHPEDDLLFDELPLKEQQELMLIAADKFRTAAKFLVSQGYFSNAQKAVNFLDSSDGRHIHDQLSAANSESDISQFNGLARWVSDYKKWNRIR